MYKLEAFLGEDIVCRQCGKELPNLKEGIVLLLPSTSIGSVFCSSKCLFTFLRNSLTNKHLAKIDYLKKLGYKKH